MKRTTFAILFLIIILTITGCSSDRYLVRTKDGKEYVSTDQPQFDKKTQTYKVIDKNGSTWILNKTDVESIGIAGSKKEASQMQSEQAPPVAPASK